MKIDKTILTLILGIVFMLCLITLVDKCSDGKKPIIQVNLPNYKTDTVMVDSIIVDTIDNPYYLDPYITYIDKGKTIVIPGKTIYKTNRDTLLDTVYIPNMGNKEISYLKFKRDSINIGWSYSGSQLNLTELQTFPADVNKWEYEYFNGKMRINPVIPQNIKVPRMIRTESNAYISYNPINRTPRLAIDYSILYRGKIGVFTMGALHIGNSNQTELQLGLVYRIK